MFARELLPAMLVVAGCLLGLDFALGALPVWVWLHVPVLAVPLSIPRLRRT